MTVWTFDHRAVEDPGAPFFNDTKYVVSQGRVDGDLHVDASQRKFSLAPTESYDNGVVYVAYRPETA